MPTVSVNTHFPGYEIIGEIGRSNARVLKARHLATGDLVAIKHFTVQTDAETLRRFRLESQLMTDIRHPNVVSVREVQLDLPMPFIVMEWIEGGSLRALMKERGQLDIPTTIRLGLQMAEAFKAIHPRGIVHRDIKPENILYRLLPSGELHFLLTDFGVARLREQSYTMTGQSLMTYEYASPEQFENPRGVDVATDYYSLGVVLYECLSGRTPFSLTDSDGIAAFMGQVLRADPPALILPSGQWVPPSLNTLIDWTLTKNPADRLSDVNEFVLLLGQANVEQLQAGRTPGRVPVRSQTLPAPKPILQPSVSAMEEPEEEPVRSSNSWTITLSAVIVVLGIALLVYFLNYRGSAKPDTTIVPDSTNMMTDSAQTEEVTEDPGTTTTDTPAENQVDSTTTVQDTVREAVPEPTPATVPPKVPDSLKTQTDTTKTSN